MNGKYFVVKANEITITIHFFEFVCKYLTDVELA